jgi:zinc D-Ala-D-Ala carboxypeptidase
MNLTPNFTLAEFTATAKRIDNTPSTNDMRALQKTAELMEQVRAVCGGKPVLISSGYRSYALNRATGGSVTSAHRCGLACDFTIPQFGTPRAICEELIAAGLVWDQLILEFPTADEPGGQWVHIGLPVLGKPRRQVLTAIKLKNVTHYQQGLARL